MAPILKAVRSRVRYVLVPLAAAGIAAAIPAAIGSSQDGGERATASARTSPQKMRCFGAPSRDPVRPCRNRALAKRVFPTPEDALLYPNAACDPVYESEPYQCTFGTGPAKANETVALLGDSHATHWRGALETLTRHYDWHGVSMTRAGCPFSTAEPVLAGKLKQECLDWRKQVRGWFETHPEVRTVFLSQHPVRVVVPKGSTERRTNVRGFREAWRSLPDTVKHVVVIRDTPYVTSQTPNCIMRAVRRRQDPGRTCALPRSRALKRDYAAEAAATFDLPGLKLVDMTPFMCDERRCFPVVGGALTHKDQGHITIVFAKTLGPFVLRKVRALGIRR